MRKLFTAVLVFALTSLFSACGGGGDSGADKPAKTDKPAAKASGSGGYSSKTVSDGGTIKGRVTFGGAMPAKQKLEVTKDVSVCGKQPHYSESVVVSDGKGLANVVVRITNIQSGKALDTMGSEFVLDQNGCVFLPHISLVPTGQALTILNSDGILHNIHTFSEVNTPVNQAQPGFKKKMSLTLEKPEIVRIACDVHNWMGGYVVAAGHPYYAITDAEGNFELSDVPAGTYTVEYWQESLGTQTAEVTVAASATAEANQEFTAGS